MDYKRAYRVLGIILILTILIVMIFRITSDISHKNNIKNNLDLTDDEKQSVNYKQLISDIKSVEDGKKLKYATLIQDNNNAKQVVKIMSTDTYYGDGYTVSDDKTSYAFYVNGRCVYLVAYIDVSAEVKNGGMTNQIKNIILYAIITIMGIVEIIFYTKCKKESKNNKIIEDKKSV